MPTKSKCAVRFSKTDPLKLFVVSADGGFFKLRYDKGDGAIESYNQFLDIE
jgi:hypothetical protein